MTSLKNLLRYAKTGVASKDMTSFDKLLALQLAGGGFPVASLSGQPPLAFKSDGNPLISWSMKGNGSQTGTPTPDNPVMPKFVGVRTGNLVDVFATDTTNGYVENAFLKKDGSLYTPSFSIVSEYFPIKAGEIYTYSIDREYIGVAQAICFYTRTKQYISGEEFQQRTVFTVVAPSNAAYIRVTLPRKPSDPELYKTTTVLNAGTEPLPYEPYGYKIPINCAGQTRPMYLGEVPTVRRIKKLVLTGTEDITSSHLERSLFNITVSGYLKNNSITVVCSHYNPQANVSEWTYVLDKRTAFHTGALSTILYICDSTYATVNDFKSYLTQQYAAGTPVTVWYVLAEPTTGIVNEPLAKIGDYADELHSEDARVSIPTAKGQNTLTVGTDLQPSEMNITGHIKAI